MGTILKRCYVFMSHDFQTVYCNWVQRKSPLTLKVVVQLHMLQQFWPQKIKMQV